MSRPVDSAPEIPQERGLRARLRAMASPKRVLLVALVFAGVGLLTLLGMPRGDLDAVSGIRLAFGVLLFGVAGLLTALVVLQPLHERPVRLWIAWSLAIASLALPLVFALLPEAHHERLLHPESFADEGPRFWARAGICLLFGSLMALPVVASILLVDRRDRLESARALQVAFAAGAAGNLALLLHCPLVSNAHLVAGHATVPVLLGTLAFLWFRRRSSHDL